MCKLRIIYAHLTYVLIMLFLALRGASTLKIRSGCKKRLNGNVPVLPIEENNADLEFDFEQCRSVLRRGDQLYIKTSDGKQI